MYFHCIIIALSLFSSNFLQCVEKNPDEIKSRMISEQRADSVSELNKIMPGFGTVVFDYIDSESQKYLVGTGEKDGFFFLGKIFPNCDVKDLPNDINYLMIGIKVFLYSEELFSGTKSLNLSMITDLGKRVYKKFISQQE